MKSTRDVQNRTWIQMRSVPRAIASVLNESLADRKPYSIVRGKHPVAENDGSFGPGEVSR
jgi:hypothetical protein